MRTLIRKLAATLKTSLLLFAITTPHTHLALNPLLFITTSFSSCYTAVKEDPLKWGMLVLQIFQMQTNNKTQNLEQELLELRKTHEARIQIADARDTYLKRQAEERINEENEIAHLQKLMKNASPKAQERLQAQLDELIVSFQRRRKRDFLSTNIARESNKAFAKNMTHEFDTWLYCSNKEMLNSSNMDPLCQSIKEFERYFTK